MSMLHKSLVPREQVGVSQVWMLQKGLVPREPVKLVCPKRQCFKRTLSQGNQSSWSVQSVDDSKGLCPEGSSQVGLSQVSMLHRSPVPREQDGVSQVWMLQKGLAPREPVKLVCPKRQCFKRALSQGNQSSWSVQSVDAPKGPRPKGTSQVGLSKASMLQKGFVPREAVKLVYPVCRCSIRAPSQGNKSVCRKCGCSKRASPQGNQSSWSVQSVDASKGLCPKGSSQVGLSQVSMLHKSPVPREQVGVSQVSMLQKGLVPREPVKLVYPKC